MFRKLWAAITGGTCVELYNATTRKTYQSIAYKGNADHSDLRFAYVFWDVKIGKVWLLEGGETEGVNFITAWRRK